MRSGRLEAFSDGVIAILITIMVLELHPPSSPGLADLGSLAPHLLAYLLSFILLAIYWNNHHHLFQVVDRVDGAVLWANMHLMFWLSLVPVVTAWLGENPTVAAPVAVYGIVLLGAGVAYYLLTLVLVRANGRDSAVAKALGTDIKGKISPAFYLAAIAAAPFAWWLSLSLYLAVAVMWFIPDPRVESVLRAQTPAEEG